MSDIHSVIVTHSHPDHFGAAGRVAKEADAELITHAAFTTWLTQGTDQNVSEREAIEVERLAAQAVHLLDVGPPEELHTVLGSNSVGDEAERLADPLRADEDDRARTMASVPWGRTYPMGRCAASVAAAQATYRRTCDAGSVQGTDPDQEGASRRSDGIGRS